MAAWRPISASIAARGRRTVGGLVAAVLTLTACTSHAGAPAAPSVVTGIGTGSLAASKSTAPPLGLVVLGHSGLTGYETSDRWFSGVANSWATGTNPRVDSIFWRLRPVEPTIVGHVANVAIPGATVAFLPEEAVSAVTAVPHPQLAIIQTVGNDITCDGKDAANYPIFGQWLDATLSDLTHLSPQTKILVLSNLGRPAGKAAAVAGNRAAKKHETGTGACSFYNAAGALQKDNVARLTAITEHYEKVERTVCARVRQCTYDGGALARYKYRLSDLIPGDWDHLDVAGQRTVAALIWPVVARVMGIPA